MTHGAPEPVSGELGGRACAPAVVPSTGRVLAFDLGSRRIGVAASDSDQALAVGVDTVERSRDDREADRRRMVGLLDEYEAVGAIVGLPLHLSGEEGPAASAARAEVDDLAALVDIPVVAHDERLTTVAASAALRAGGKRSRQQRAVIDRTAAAVLLQSWLDRRRADRIQTGTIGATGPGRG